MKYFTVDVVYFDQQTGTVLPVCRFWCKKTKITPKPGKITTPKC